jgi:hypothetical protein
MRRAMCALLMILAGGQMILAVDGCSWRSSELRAGLHGLPRSPQRFVGKRTSEDRRFGVEH